MEFVEILHRSQLSESKKSARINYKNKRDSYEANHGKVWKEVISAFSAFSFYIRINDMILDNFCTTYHHQKSLLLYYEMLILMMEKYMVLWIKEQILEERRMDFYEFMAVAGSWIECRQGVYEVFPVRNLHQMMS